MGSVYRGVHSRRQYRGAPSDDNNPCEAAFERHLLSCGHGAGEPQYDQECQHEASCGTVAFHGISPLSSGYCCRLSRHRFHWISPVLCRAAALPTGGRCHLSVFSSSGAGGSAGSGMPCSPSSSAFTSRPVALRICSFWHSVSSSRILAFLRVISSSAARLRGAARDLAY